LLRDLYGEVPESINKGTNLTISNADAEMLVIYTYSILGDLVLEKTSHNKKNNVNCKNLNLIWSMFNVIIILV